MHVTSPDFGAGISESDLVREFLDYFSSLRDSKVAIDGYTVDMLLKESYEDIFGISDLNDPKQPLALVRYTNADTLGDLSTVAECIREYRVHELGDKYGLSIKEYFDMPVNIAKLLISNSRSEKQDMDDIVSTADKQANKDWKNKNK